MDRPEADAMLARSRELQWTFPSSSGRPVAKTVDPAIATLLDERESIVEAARFFVAAGDAAAATELAASTWRLWMLARDIPGGRAFLSGALDSTEAEPSATRALALYGDGLFAFWQGAQEESRERNEAALEAARASGDAQALALAHLGLSRVALRNGDYELGREHAVSAREQAAALEPAMGQAPLHMHAQSRWGAGDLDEAAALFAESLELNRSIGDEGMVGVELHNLGHVEARRGNVDVAERLFEECAELGSDDDAYSLASREVNAATVAFARGDRDRAADLLVRGESILHEAGVDTAGEDEISWLREQLGASG